MSIHPDQLYHGDLARSHAQWHWLFDYQKYMTHRLPGIVVTKKGTVIIYCEARTHKETDGHGVGSLDHCLMDIFIQRSVDQGKTFSAPQYIAYGNTRFETMNNPVMIVGNDNILHLFYCRNCAVGNGSAWYTRSYDDGVSWEPAKDLKEVISAVPHNLLLFGPGHGLCTSKGRLIVPVWLTPPGLSEMHVYTMFSDDNGETWHMGERASENEDETTIAELSDGRIMLNSRKAKCRRISISDDGATNWSQTYADPNLPDPGCMGGMDTVRINGLPHALLFVNCSSTTDRDHVTVKCSFDDGKSWKSFLIDEFEGGYADVAIDQNGKVYVIYETFMGVITRLTSFSFYDAFMKQ